MFQRIIGDRKFLATLLPTSAALFGELAVSRIVETEGSQDMIPPRETADLVIMNPLFTRPTGP